jgi:hypothetical protein
MITPISAIVRASSGVHGHSCPGRVVLKPILYGSLRGGAIGRRRAVVVVCAGFRPHSSALKTIYQPRQVLLLAGLVVIATPNCQHLRIHALISSLTIDLLNTQRFANRELPCPIGARHPRRKVKTIHRSPSASSPVSRHGPSVRPIHQRHKLGQHRHLHSRGGHHNLLWLPLVPQTAHTFPNIHSPPTNSVDIPRARCTPGLGRVPIAIVFRNLGPLA